MIDTIRCRRLFSHGRLNITKWYNDRPQWSVWWPKTVGIIISLGHIVVIWRIRWVNGRIESA